MSQTLHTHRSHNEGSPVPEPRAWLFIRRALRLRCPECGISPLYVPLKQVRTLHDWSVPLDGCPRCGYAYLREEGYFLLATWGVNYGVVAGLGMFISLMFEWLHPLPFKYYLFFILGPMPILSFLMIRHAKSLFLAMDHFFDPHRKNP